MLAHALEVRNLSVDNGPPGPELFDLLDGARIDEAAVLQLVPDVVAGLQLFAGRPSGHRRLIAGLNRAGYRGVRGGRRPAVGALVGSDLEGRDRRDSNFCVSVPAVVAAGRKGARLKDDRLRR